MENLFHIAIKSKVIERDWMEGGADIYSSNRITEPPMEHICIWCTQVSSVVTTEATLWFPVPSSTATHNHISLARSSPWFSFRLLLSTMRDCHNARTQLYLGYKYKTIRLANGRVKPTITHDRNDIIFAIKFSPFPPSYPLLLMLRGREVE